MRTGVVCVSMIIAAVAAPVCRAQGALNSIDACIKRLDPQIDVGYARLATRCPELTRHLEASGWSAWLPPQWKAPDNDLSAAGLAELRALVVREGSAKLSPRAPDPRLLQPILSDLGQGDQDTDDRQTRTVWSRFTQWIREVPERRESPARAGWIDRLFARLGPSQAILEVVTYACLALVVLLAAGIVAYELHRAGVFGARRGKKTEPASPVRGRRSRGPDWTAIQGAPLGERAGMLLEFIAARLVERNRLPPAEGMTARELTQAARLSSGEDRALLADVAGVAERARYSAQPVMPASVESAVERGRTLLEHIQVGGAA